MRRIFKVISKILLLIFVIALLIVAFWSGGYLFHRKHGSVSTQKCQFTESAKELNNPYRGFYSIYGFTISDEEQDYEWQIAQLLSHDQDSLVLVQLNLCNYVDGDISQMGMKNVEALFAELAQTDKHYIVRFLYDWEGKGKENEPKHIETILRHMEQLEKIFHMYQDNIFIHQGIFVGNCGEMHGSKYLSNPDMKRLMTKLQEITPSTVFLSVRTPQQWRIITEIAEIEDVYNLPLACRLGLFNDGMMGTLQDTGTYGINSRIDVGDFEKWNREEELIFQEELCKIVPNGGEVIIHNALNDFSNAVQSMETMHITYLNRLHDKEVLDKWAATVVTEDGCYKGMDGLTYIDRHLGYRLLINNVFLNYESHQDILTVGIDLQNVGFAPMYKESNLFCLLKKTDSSDYISFQIHEDIRCLSGGRLSDEVLKIQKPISLSGFAAGNYEIYFYIEDATTGRHILLANEQNEEKYGYRIGSITIEPIRNPFTGEEIVLEIPKLNWLQEKRIEE